MAAFLPARRVDLLSPEPLAMEFRENSSAGYDTGCPCVSNWEQPCPTAQADVGVCRTPACPIWHLN